jgi:hypothetical protein
MLMTRAPADTAASIRVARRSDQEVDPSRRRRTGRLAAVRGGLDRDQAVGLGTSDVRRSSASFQANLWLSI